MWQRAHFSREAEKCSAEVYSTVSCSQTFRLNMYQLRRQIPGGADNVRVAGREFVARKHLAIIRSYGLFLFSDSIVQSRQRQMCRCE